MCIVVLSCTGLSRHSSETVELVDGCERLKNHVDDVDAAFKEKVFLTMDRFMLEKVFLSQMCSFSNVNLKIHQSNYSNQLTRMLFFQFWFTNRIYVNSSVRVILSRNHLQFKREEQYYCKVCETISRNNEFNCVGPFLPKTESH